MLKFLPSRVALGHASSLLSLLLCHNNKLSRLDACPSTTREGKNFNTYFWAAYEHTRRILSKNLGYYGFITPRNGIYNFEGELNIIIALFIHLKIKKYNGLTFTCLRKYICCRYVFILQIVIR